MRFLALASAALVIAGCARSDTDSAAAAPDFAGTWQVRGNNEAGDSVVSYRLVATADTTGWSITFANGQTVPVRVVSVAGDSVITEAGPYESVLRPGVQVSTHNIFRRSGEGITGVTHARYSVSTADSMLTVQSTGTRVP